MKLDRISYWEKQQERLREEKALLRHERDTRLAEKKEKELAAAKAQA